MALRNLTIAIATLILAAGQAYADDAADIAAGADLAKRWCSKCHVIGPEAAGGDAGPSFESVAKRPGVSEQSIETWLADPHPPMNTLSLTATDTRVLTRYIFSLGH
jgi:cytochrome c2